MRVSPNITLYRRHSSAFRPGMYAALSVLAFVMLWWAVSASGYVHAHTVPSPVTVLETLAGLITEERTDFTYYAFSRTHTLWAHVGDTSFRLLVSIVIGGMCGVLLGSLGAVYAVLSTTVSVWSVIYLSGFPRLVEILYLNHLGLIGHSAPILLGTLSVTSCVALSTQHALKDDELRDQVEHARLDAPISAILIAIVIPQKRWNIATGWWLGTAAALSLTYFCEYMQSTSGVGYLLQIAFSGDVRIREAFAITVLGMSILACACLVVYLLTRYLPESMVWALRRLWYGPRR